MLLELLRKRRSIRKYTGQPVEPKKIDALMEMVLRAPSSRGLKPWQFVVVQNPQTLAKLAGVKAHSVSFLQDAPLAVVVLGDEARCDVWIEDCSLASAILHLGAADLGLGSCWVQIRKRMDGDGACAEANCREILGIPGHFRVLSIIGIGYPAEEKLGVPTESLDSKVIHFEKF